MVINENLALNNFEDGQVIKDMEDGYKFFDIGNLSDLDLIDGETYTVSFVLEQTEKGCGKFNAGPLSFAPKTLLDRTNYEIKDRSSFKFVYDQNKHSSLAVYTDLVSRSAGVGGTIKNVKIEKGDEATPYIPSKNNIDPSKQAIFKAGGGIQRGVSTLRLKLVEIDQLCMGVWYVS